MSDTLLEIRDLKKHFPVMKGIIFQKPVGLVKAVDGVSYAIGVGETVGLVGESGCGKTTTMKMILMLEKPTAGSILFRGEDIQDLAGKDFRAYRKGVQAVFQDPYSSLNPRMRVGDIIMSRWSSMRHFRRPRSGSVSRVAESCWPAPRLDRSLSARIQWRTAPTHRHRAGLSLNPSLIILDEPVSHARRIDPCPDHESLTGSPGSSSGSAICLLHMTWRPSCT